MRDELTAVIREQNGRRFIVKVRELVEFADGRAESAMESETRLVFIDGGLPLPELQYEIVDKCGKLWRVDSRGRMRCSPRSTTASNDTPIPTAQLPRRADAKVPQNL